MTASIPLEAMGMQRSMTPGQLGTGVEFSSIMRIRESFLDAQYRNESQSNGSWSIQLDSLQKLETIINEPSDTGIRSILDKFWNSWQDLSENPESITARKLVRETAIALTDAFNQAGNQLDALTADLTENINVKVTQMNTLSSTITSLNAQIRRTEAFGDNANDLRDQRDLLVDQLSKIANISVQETSNGYQIRMGSQVLVDGDNQTDVTVSGLEGSFGGDLTGGEVYGMIRSRDHFVADYKNQLNTLINGIAYGEIEITLPAGAVLPEGTTLNGVTYNDPNRTLTSNLTVTVKGLNGLHQLGYTNQNPLQSGGDFFTSSNGGPLTLNNIKVSNEILADANNIGSSMRTHMDGTTEKSVVGNKDLAMLIAQMNNTKINFASVSSTTSTSLGTANDFFRSFVGQLGVQTEEAQRQANNSDIVVGQIDSRRQSVSGVSLDEEMADMIKFQHAYNAAARFMTAIDETLDKIINGMGVVGR